MARKGSGDPEARRKARQRRPKMGEVIRGVFEGGGGDEPPIDGELPECPIPLDDEGRRCWRHHVAILVRDARFDPERDLELLAGFCLAWSRVVAGERMVDEEGITAPTADGSTKKHPAVTVVAEHLTTLKQYASELGLSPASRKRLPEKGGETVRDGKRDRARELLD